MACIKYIVLTFILTLSLFARAEILPIEDFVKHGDYLEFNISPDGKHFAARLRQDDEVILVFIRRSDNQVVGGIKPQSNGEIHSVTWVNNNRVVYEIADKQPDGERPIPTGELFSVDPNGAQSKLIYGYRASDSQTGSLISTKENDFASQEILSILPDDNKNILIIEYPWEKYGRYWYDSRKRGAVISKLNVYTGHKNKIETIPYNDLTALADHQGQVNFISWRDDQNKIYTAYRKKNKQPWQDMSTALQIDNTYVPVAINADSSKVYLSVALGTQRIDNLFELELSTGKLTQVFEDVESDLVDWIVDNDTMEPVVGITYPNKAKYIYANTNSSIGNLHRALVNTFNGATINITSRTQDAKLLVVHVESDVNPGEYYIYDTVAKKVDLAMINNSWIDPRQMREMNSIEFSARDGLKIQGYLTLPASEKEKSLPLLVLVHGGPHQVRDYWTYDNEVQLFANRGYAVLQINYRGSRGFGGEFEEIGYRQWGGKMIDDIIDGTEWAIKNNKSINGLRTCIYGASYGGYAALMAAAKAPDQYACAIGYAGIYDLELMYTKGDIPDSWGGEAYLEKVIGRDTDELKLFSPYHQADKIKAPVMLIHGKKDKRVPYAHAKSMRKKLKTLGRDPTWLTYGNSKHGVWSVKNQKELYTELLDFLDKHIGAKSK